jgi:hypothetical protein
MRLLCSLITTTQLSPIPTVGGPSGVLSSYLGAIKRIRLGDGRQVVQEGIEKVTHYQEQIGCGLIIVFI